MKKTIKGKVSKKKKKTSKEIENLAEPENSTDEKTEDS